MGGIGRGLFPIVCTVVAVSCGGGSPHAADRILTLRYAGNGPDWEQADTICIERPQESDNRMSVAGCWDRDSLYFALEVRDGNLQAFQTEKDHPRLFLDDMVEVLLDTQTDRAGTWQDDDLVYHINILGAKKDDKGLKNGVSNAEWDGNARYTVVLHGTVNDAADEDRGYRIELAIPWSEIGRTPAEGMRMGVNFANGDNDGRGRQLYNWCDADPMRMPAVFGELRLTK